MNHDRDLWISPRIKYEQLSEDQRYKLHKKKLRRTFVGVQCTIDGLKRHKIVESNSHDEKAAEELLLYDGSIWLAYGSTVQVCCRVSRFVKKDAIDALRFYTVTDAEGSSMTMAVLQSMTPEEKIGQEYDQELVNCEMLDRAERDSLPLVITAFPRVVRDRAQNGQIVPLLRLTMLRAHFVSFEQYQAFPLFARAQEATIRFDYKRGMYV